MFHRIRTALLAAVAATFLIAATTASAAPATWSEISVTLHSEQGGSVVLVTGQLPETTKLPAEVEMAVPAGTELQWAGELLGGDIADDPTVKYTKSTRDSLDVYKFTVAQSRTAQLEVIWPHQPEFDGQQYTTGLQWATGQTVPLVRLSVRLPNSAQIGAPAEGATMIPGETGYNFYSKDFKNVTADKPSELFFTYSLPAAGGSGSATAQSSSNVALVLLTLAFAGAGLFVFGAVRRKMAANTALDSAPVQRTSRVVATEPDAFAEESEPETVIAQEDDEASAPAPRSMSKRTIIVLVVVAALVLGGIFASAQGSGNQAVDGKPTRFFGAADPCTNTSIAVTPKPGVDLAESASKLLDGFTGAEGIGDVTVNAAASTVDIGFCDSSQSEDSLRQMLTATGLVDVSAASAPSQETTSAQ